MLFLHSQCPCSWQCYASDARRRRRPWLNLSKLNDRRTFISPVSCLRASLSAASAARGRQLGAHRAAAPRRGAQRFSRSTPPVMADEVSWRTGATCRACAARFTAIEPRCRTVRMCMHLAGEARGPLKGAARAEGASPQINPTRVRLCRSEARRARARAARVDSVGGTGRLGATWERGGVRAWLRRREGHRVDDAARKLPLEGGGLGPHVRARGAWALPSPPQVPIDPCMGAEVTERWPGPASGVGGQAAMVAPIGLASGRGLDALAAPGTNRWAVGSCWWDAVGLVADRKCHGIQIKTLKCCQAAKVSKWGRGRWACAAADAPARARPLSAPRPCALHPGWSLRFAPWLDSACVAVWRWQSAV